MTLFASNEAPANTETAILAGGCFWGMEEIIRDIPGVVDTDVGYSGGRVKDATYADVACRCRILGSGSRRLPISRRAD